MPPFQIGINYWPARTAMAMWSDFNEEEIDADLARIAEAGFGFVRFFLLWEAFQPEPDRLDAVALGKMERFLELLQARNLRGVPTLFCGHMSGVNFLPGWTLDPGTVPGRFRTISDGKPSTFGVGEFYRAGPLLAAQRFHVRTIGARFRGHPAIAMWDLGNEFSNLREPPGVGAAAAWSRTLATDLRATSQHPVTGGLHGEDLERDRLIRPSSISTPWDFASMHGYSVYSTFSRGRLDIEVVPFLHDLTAGFTGKPVLFSEFGNPSCMPGAAPGAKSLGAFACLDDDEMAQYASLVLDRLQRHGAMGAGWWCYSDYDDALANTPPFDKAPHEMRFGAWRADGTPKPVVAAISAFAAEGRPVAEMRPPMFSEDEWYADPMQVKERYDEYLAKLKQNP